MTYEHPWYIQQQLLENITTSDVESTPNPAKVSLGRIRTDLSNNRKGDIAELYVCLIAEWKGADVFRNVGCDGKTDIVLKIDGTIAEIDVKVAQWKPKYNSWISTAAADVELPVYPVLVIPEGDIMDWKIRWKGINPGPNSPPHCPLGLETFWDKPSTHV